MANFDTQQFVVGSASLTDIDNDIVKRLIGKGGRNIRNLEKITGTRMSIENNEGHYTLKVEAKDVESGAAAIEKVKAEAIAIRNYKSERNGDNMVEEYNYDDMVSSNDKPLRTSRQSNQNINRTTKSSPPTFERVSNQKKKASHVLIEELAEKLNDCRDRIRILEKTVFRLERS